MFKNTLKSLLDFQRNEFLQKCTEDFIEFSAMVELTLHKYMYMYKYKKIVTIKTNLTAFRVSTQKSQRDERYFSHFTTGVITCNIE